MSENNGKFSDLDTGVAIAVGFAFLLVIVGLAAVVASSVGVFSDDLQGFDYPTGASESGFEDVETLVNTHQQNLQNDSFTVAIENRAGGEQTASLTYEYDPEQALSVRTEDLNNGNNEIVEDYVNQQLVIAQGVGTENVTYNREFLQQSLPYTARFEITNFLQAANYTAVDVVQNNGEDVVVYEIDSLTQQTQQQVDSVSGEVRLSESGQFTLIDLNVTTTAQGQEITENQRIEFTDVGSTSVEEPEWLGTALNQTEEPEPPQPPQQPPTGDDSGTEDGTDDSTDDSGGTNNEDSDDTQG